MSKWKNARSFVELAFAIDKHLPGYVDAYFGPAEIKESTNAKEKLELEELSTTLGQIVISTQQDATLTDARREYLSAELKAMQTTLRILKGEEIDIVEETQGLYGLAPAWIEESVFEEAHRAIEELLPGSGTLPERMKGFEEKTVIPEEELEPIIKKLADDFQRRTLEIISLPEDESCEYALVQDKPWTGYNWYLGKYASRIDINTDLPTFAAFIPRLVAHEAYPGHHTEHAMKEKELYRDRGYLENSIQPLNAPSCVISEGVAENALEMIATPDETIQIYQSILQQAGLKQVSGDQIYQISEARRALDKFSINAILLLHGEGASDEEVVNYGVRYALITEQESKKYLEFFKDPLSRSYGFLYPLGYELVHNYVGNGEDRIKRFTRLLREPITTSQLIH